MLEEENGRLKRPMVDAMLDTRALADHGVADSYAADVALHFQAVLQGGFILAKAAGDPEPTRAGVRHLERSVILLCKGERA